MALLRVTHGPPQRTGAGGAFDQDGRPGAGQNGVVVTQATKIAASGCTRRKKVKHQARLRV
jgi:hypothetical protein